MEENDRGKCRATHQNSERSAHALHHGRLARGKVGPVETDIVLHGFAPVLGLFFVNYKANRSVSSRTVQAVPVNFGRAAERGQESNTDMVAVVAVQHLERSLRLALFLDRRRA